MSWILSLAANERKVHSQGGQDGIIESIVSHIGTENNPPFCVEFGFNSDSLVGGTGANVANLVLNQGWQCLLLDGDHENPAINLHRHHLTSSNICELLRQYACPASPDYVSIDVDSTDLWLMVAMLGEYRPRFLSVEYNSNFPIEYAITHPDGQNLSCGATKATYGASLRSLWLVGERHGYSLVHVVRQLDAFFVRDDLLAGEETPSLESFSGSAGLRLHRRASHASCCEFLDYEELLNTGGNVAAARSKAEGPAKRFLGETA